VPTRQQLEEALFKAHTSGDYEAANTFADMVRSGQYDETTLLGRVGEFAKGIPRGFASTFASSVEGIGALADVATDAVGLDDLIDSGDENALIYAGRSARDAIDEVLAPAPGYEGLWTTKFGDALGLADVA